MSTVEHRTSTQNRSPRGNFDANMRRAVGWLWRCTVDCTSQGGAASRAQIFNLCMMRAEVLIAAARSASDRSCPDESRASDYS